MGGGGFRAEGAVGDANVDYREGGGAGGGDGGGEEGEEGGGGGEAEMIPFWTSQTRRAVVIGIAGVFALFGWGNW